MSTDDQIRALEQKIESLIRDDPGNFLVEIRIKPTNNVKIFIDADTGVSIDKLVQYNRKLYRDLDETGFFPGGDFSLEVSSPGLEEPLRLYRQYLKNIGRYVEVVQVDGSKMEGKLIRASETEIEVEEERARLSGRSVTDKHGKAGQGKNNKKEVVAHIISFDNIKTTKIQIKF